MSKLGICSLKPPSCIWMSHKLSVAGQIQTSSITTMTGVLDDLQQIIPEGFKASVANRKTYVVFGAVILSLALLSMILAGLLAHALVSGGGSPSVGSSGGSAAAVVMGGAKLTPQVMETAAWMGQNIDPSVDKCENFYKFACGGWEARHTIPPDRSGVNMYTHLRADNEEKLRDIIDSPIVRNTPESVERKMKEFFKMCLHDYGRMKEGGKKLLEIIRTDLKGWYVLDPDGWSTQWDTQRAISRLQGQYLVGVFFDVSMTYDPADHRKNIMAINQGGLGMYYSNYIDNYSNYIKLRESYKDYMRQVATFMLRDANITLSDTDRAERVEQFVTDAYGHEEHMAQLMSSARRTSGWWRTKKTTLGELHTNFTQIDWTSVFEHLYHDIRLSVSGWQKPPTVDANTEVAIRPAPYFTLLERVLVNETQDRDRILNNYMIWRLLDEYVPHLSWDYQHARYAFMESRSGRSEFKSTWEACVDTVRDRLGMVLAGVFLQMHVTKEAKDKVEDMVTRIQAAYNTSIDANTWMDDVTKARSKEKVNDIIALIGFPVIWLNQTFVDQVHEKLVINKSLGYFEGLLSVNHMTRVLRAEELQIGYIYYLWTNPLKFRGFGVHPLYFYLYNMVVIPSGSMQFPMYAKGGLDFFNYGALGTAIGVELANSINDMGRYEYINGTFMDWWTETSSDNYLKVEACFETYFTGIKVGPFLVQGQNQTMTLDGSNQAWRAVDEMAGMRTAYTAYKKWMSEGNVSQQEKQFVYPPDQAFFISAAQTHCYKVRDVTAYHWASRNYIPPDVILNGMLSHMPEFAKAFSCSDGSKMKAAETCDV